MKLHTLGLWGDGDEIHAIEDAFAAIGVGVPVEDASEWRTVGDLWRTVERLDPQLARSDERWITFCKAIAEESCVDWQMIDRSTTPLDGRGHSVISRLWTSLRERFSKNA